MYTYTLNDLAHFDRCLFADSFERDLIKHGMCEGTAFFVKSWIINERNKGNKIGIIDVYQYLVCSCIDEDVRNESKQILEAVVTDHVSRQQTRN